MAYVGLDLAKESIVGSVIDSRGRIIKQEKFNNNPEEISKFFQGIRKSKVVIEAGYGWEPVYDQLKQEGHNVVLAHPKEIKAVAKAKIKTDKISSTLLAKLLRADLIPLAYSPSLYIRELRNKCRHRAYLVQTRTRFINKIKAEVFRRRIELPTKSIGLRARKYIKSLRIPVLERYVDIIDLLNHQITEVEEEILSVANSTKEVEILRSIGGIDYFLGLMMYSEIADINRFLDSEDICCYTGLVPRISQSGKVVRKGQLIRDCNHWLRWALIQASWAHLRSRGDSYLKQHYRKVLRRTKNKQKAIVAMARKLCKAIWWMLKFNKRFIP